MNCGAPRFFDGFSCRGERSGGIKVLYGESAEKQERVVEKLGMEVGEYYCARKDRLGGNILFEGWRWRAQEGFNTIASNVRPVEKRMPLRSREVGTAQRIRREVALCVAL